MSQKKKNYLSLLVILFVFLILVQFASAASETLKSGMSGDSVFQLQKDLKTLGYMSIDPTGYFGDITKEAVVKFQNNYGLTADGVAGAETLNKIDSLLNSATSAAGALKSGMSGDDVSQLQTDLKALGFMSISPTGYFGDVTEAAVSKFQKEYGLASDGVAGVQTLNKIDELLKRPVNISRGIEQTGQKIVAYAKRFLGVSYVWGGMSPKGFDCSGFVKYVFDNFGITLNRVAAEQSKQGTFVKKENLRAGDLVFFDTDGGHNYINHVGIYIGAGKFIQASSGSSGVIISDITEGFYAKAYMTARRVLD